MLIERFSIRNLFGMYNIDLDLNELVTIFVGENGLGKTTILNCLFYILKCNFEKLKDINFESIEIKFEKNKIFKINYTDILEYTRERIHYNNYEDSRQYRYIEDIFNEEEINRMIYIVKSEQYEISILRNYAIKLNEVTGMPIRLAERTIYRFCLERLNSKIAGNAENVIRLMNFIKENSISDKVIYFTTYRRIEKNIFESRKNIREYDDDILTRKTNDLIHFGMDDVLELINKNLKIISSLAVDGYSEMAGILLNQYLYSNVKESNKYNIDSQKLNIALDRIGNKINDKTKNEIKNKIKEKDRLKDENKYLLNLLENLINNYEKQNEYDEKIRNFTNTCNKYLNGKKFEYNESSVEVNIINKISNEPININNLSSGEKQIIAIFARLYFDTEGDAIVLIDEPELSLSINWQSMLMPDIVNTNKCKKIVTVTHSPFIFDNEYERYAKSIKNVFNLGSK